MIDRHDPCTVQPAYLFLRGSRSRDPAGRSSRHPHTNQPPSDICHLPSQKKKYILVQKVYSLANFGSNLGPAPSLVNTIDRLVVPGREREERERERWWKLDGCSHFALVYPIALISSISISVSVAYYLPLSSSPSFYHAPEPCPDPTSLDPSTRIILQFASSSVSTRECPA